jgi:predicted ribonuclease YlaK
MALATEPRREDVPAESNSPIALPQAYPLQRKREGLPRWLDLDVPDDRFIASALEVRREHPKARIVVVSGDFNVLTKARAARLPAFDAEAFFEQSDDED